MYYRFARTLLLFGAWTNTESSSRTPAGINHHRRVTSTLSKDSQIARWFIAAMLAAVNRLLAVRFKQRDALHTAHQALGFVGKED